MKLFQKLIVPFGIVTYGFVFTTFLYGFFGWNFQTHRALAIVAIILATLHGITMILMRAGVIAKLLRKKKQEK